MKKQSASTINLFNLTNSHDKRKTMMALKNALISLGLKYVPEKRDREKLQKKHPLRRGGASSPFDS